MRTYTRTLMVALVVFLAAGTFMVAKSQPVLRHLGYFDVFDPNTDPVANALEEVTGYKVEYEMLPAENATEVLGLRISSGDAYDSLKISRDQFDLLVGQDALMPLNDLLKRHGQRILEVIDEDSWNAVTVHGKIYGVPEKPPADNINYALVVRKDVLNDLGLAVPTTIDEFYHVLKTIKEKTDLIPLTMDSSEVLHPSILSAFGLCTNWLDLDGQLVHLMNHPRLAEYLEFMNKLYLEGLIDPDFPVLNRTAVIQKFTGGRAAMMRMAYWEPAAVIPALEGAVPDATTALIHPLIGANGEQGVALATGIVWNACIPITSRNAEEVIKWWNAKLDQKGFLYWVLGKEGVHYTYQDGIYFPVLPAFGERNNASWFLSGSDEKNYPIYWQARLWKAPIIAHVYMEIMSVAPQIGKVDPLAFAPSLQAISRYNQSTAVLISDNMLNFIVGTRALKELDEFRAEWEHAGGQAMASEANAWYQNIR